MNNGFRCSVIGNAGGGKSILSRALASKSETPLYELDQYLWTENWQSVKPEKFQAQHNEMIESESWIIDGFGLVDTIWPRINRSTHIVFVDLPIWLHFALAAERQLTWKQGDLKYPPGDMKVPPPTKALFEMMWKIHTELRPTVQEAVEKAALKGTSTEVVTSTNRLRELQFNPGTLLEQ